MRRKAKATQDELARYTQGLARQETLGVGGQTVEIGPYTSMLVISAVSLVLRSVDEQQLGGPNRALLEAFVDQLSLEFTGTLGEEVIRRLTAGGLHLVRDDT